MPSFEYHRPDSLEAALALLGRSAPVTRPLGGGTRLISGAERAAATGGWAVVDLVALPLAGVGRSEAVWRIGATTTLDTLATASDLPQGLRRAAERQAPRNIRQRATVGGAIAGRNAGPLLAALLALDARLAIEPGGALVTLDSYLQGYERPGHLIVAVEVPVTRACALAEISRAPADAPVLVVAVGGVIEDGATADRATADRATAGNLYGRYVRQVIAAATGADQPVFLVPGAAQLLEAAPESDLAALTAATPDLPWHSDPRGSKQYRNAMTPVLLRRAAGELLAAEVSHAD